MPGRLARGIRKALASGAIAGSIGTNDIANALVPSANVGVPKVSVLTETHAFGTFTDGGGTSGTKSFTGALPAGAVVLHTSISALTGFTGNVSATVTIGDGSDVDRYNTGTPSVFTTAAAGIDIGVPSGARFHDVTKTPVITVTSSSDFTAVAAGSMTVNIYYIKTV